MNNVRALLQTARASSEPGVLYSDHMLAELAALHEEMVAQLLLELLSGADNSDFIVSMTAQHERAAASLRSRLQPLVENSAGETESPGRSTFTRTPFAA
jgi:hypothetical protein